MNLNAFAHLMLNIEALLFPYSSVLVFIHSLRIMDAIFL